MFICLEKKGDLFVDFLVGYLVVVRDEDFVEYCWMCYRFKILEFFGEVIGSDFSWVFDFEWLYFVI